MATDKRRIFIDEYTKTWNATAAARTAGYKYPGQEGYRLLRIAEIKAEIDARLEESGMSGKEIIARLAQQARGAGQDIIEIKAGLPFLNWEQLAEAGGLNLIKKLKYDNEGRPEVEFYDAQAALVHLGKHLGLFVDRQEVSGPDGGPIRITGLESLSDDDLAKLTQND